MEDAREILSVHLSSFLTPASLLLFHLLSPGGFLGTPLFALSLLSLAASLAALLAPFLFLSPVPLEPSSPGPVKPFRHYVYEHKDTKRHGTPDGVSPTPVSVCTWKTVYYGSKLTAAP